MALTEERYFRMAKRGCIYNKDTGQPYGDCYFKINDCKLDDKVDFDPFELGGEQVGNAVKKRTFTVSFTAGSYKNGLAELLTNGIVTTKNSVSGGEVSGFENYNGTTAYSATTGIASGTVTDKTELKECIYVFVVTAATKGKIYAYSDLSFNDGTAVALVDDTMAIMAEITLTNGGSTAITGHGFSLVGGSSVAMTVGDSCTFEVRRADVVGEEILVTGDTDFADVGLYLFPDKYNNEYSLIDCYSIKLGGMPIEVKDSWSTYQITATLTRDDAKNGYYRIIRNRPA